MEVPGSHNRYYTEFIHKPDDLQTRLFIEDWLIVNFNSDKRSGKEDRPAMVMNGLPCKPLGDICVSMQHRPGDPKASVYFNQTMDALPFDSHSDPPDSQVTRRLLDKMIGLQKLYEEDHYRWWKRIPSGQNRDRDKTVSTFISLVRSEAMNFLKGREIIFNAAGISVKGFENEFDRVLS